MANVTEQQSADVIVIGSGFGGAVAAARLAQAGFSVVVLERGRRWKPGSFPRRPRIDDGWLWGVDRGLYSIRWLGRMLTVQAAGWGGGSLAYANVFARPFDRAFDERWPARLRRRQLDPYYDLAAHMLGVSPVGTDPTTGRVPPRAELIERHMRDGNRGDATIRPNLAVTFGDPQAWRPNKHGVMQRGCTFVGECVIGCNHGAKNSLDLTYLAVAESEGATAVTDAEVTRIEPRDGEYVVTTSTPTNKTSPPREWRAPRVVLAAGAVATTELLLRSRDVHGTLPRLSSHLGAGFSGNGDFLTLAELKAPDGDMTTGPTITTSTIIDVPEGRGTVWFQVQDGAFPRAVHDLLDAVMPAARAREWWRRRRAAPDRGRIFTVLAMGHDSANGTLRLNRWGSVTLDWRNRWQSRLYRSQRRVGPFLERVLRARLYNPFTWSVLRRTTTVHPLGGIRAGEHPDTDVVDEAGEVHGYPGLYVMDGSVLPTSTGVNPSATILAVAERSVETLIRSSGKPEWSAPEWGEVTPAAVPEDHAALFAADLRTSTRGGGVHFAERMLTTRSSRPRVTLKLNVEAPSIDGFLADPTHTLRVTGTVDAENIATDVSVWGTLSLFPDGRDEAMIYELEFTDASGDARTLIGTKSVSSRTPLGLLGGLTRLRTNIGSATAGDTNDVRDAELFMGTRDLVGILASMRGHGFTRARRLRTVARFALFFARSAITRPPVRVRD